MPKVFDLLYLARAVQEELYDFRASLRRGGHQRSDAQLVRLVHVRACGEQHLSCSSGPAHVRPDLTNWLRARNGKIENLKITQNTACLNATEIS